VAVDVPATATAADVVGANVCSGANGVKAVVVVVARFRRIVVVVVLDAGTVVVVVLTIEVVVVEVVVVVSDEPLPPWFVEAAGTVVFVVNEATSFPTVS
jgi:hypothetical protein